MLIRFVLILLLFSGSVFAAPPLTEMSNDQLRAFQNRDITSVNMYRNGLTRIFNIIDTRSDIFTKEKQHVLTNKQRQEALYIWQSIIDYYFALDSISRYHNQYLKIKDKQLRYRSFTISRAALYAEYRYALDFIRVFEQQDIFDVIFNESMLYPNMYKKRYQQFKTRYLNLIKATEFSAYEATALTFSKPEPTPLDQGIEIDKKIIWKTAVKDGPSMTVKNGLNTLRNTGKEIWFPVQKRVANWMGNVRVMPRENNLISPEQIDTMKNRLLPGDILLERREWALTNVGIPGFWTHAALYIGTPENRTQFFSTDPSVQKWLKERNANSVDQFIEKTVPMIYRTGLQKDNSGHTMSVIEAISPGVVFTSLEHSADCDSIAILRPRVSNLSRAKAVITAFSHVGKPYDYDFNFNSDKALVCTELVYKSYDAGNPNSRFQLPIIETMGRPITPANEFAKHFTDTFGTSKQQMDLILFIDGNELKRKATISTADEFMNSWKRPKWHIIQKGIKDKVTPKLMSLGLQ